MFLHADHWPSSARLVERVKATVAVLLPILIVAYGAVLRLDAITLKYSTVSHPGWLRSLQAGPHSPLLSVRPARMTWSPEPVVLHRDGPTDHYDADPYTYLEYARAMRSFYAAHPREPGFPFVTRVALHLLRDQSIAVSFASMFGSVLVIAATFLLGWYTFSWWVGIGASIGIAIDYDVITWSVGGWRDDWFIALLLISTLVMLRFARQPTPRGAVLMGVTWGAACLFRTSSLSFVVPSLVYLLASSRRPWRARLGFAGLAVVTMTVAVGPYLFNCWRQSGDPFLSLAAHIDRSTGRDGLAAPGAGAASDTSVPRLTVFWRNQPMRTLDTVATGMTTYSFWNKWRGFDVWNSSLGKWLAWASLAGLPLLALSSSGRLLLLVMTTSLLPFAATWSANSEWRLTECNYPFLLIAASLALTEAVRLLRPSLARSIRERPGSLLRPALTALVIGLVIGVGAWIVADWLPIQNARESLRAGEEVTLNAGDRDWPFLGRGWSGAMAQGAATVRTSRGAESDLWLPLEGNQDYDVILRIDPDPPLADPLATTAVNVSLDGRPLTTLQLRSTFGRMGSYEIRIDRGRGHAGFGTLGLRVATRDQQASPDRATSGFRVWYVRIRPLSNAGPPG